MEAPWYPKHISSAILSMEGQTRSSKSYHIATNFLNTVDFPANHTSIYYAAIAIEEKWNEISFLHRPTRIYKLHI